MNAVPIETLEHEKENIQLVARGRSAKALAENLQADRSSMTQATARRQQLEEAIAQAMDQDDPLEPYLQYINWIHDTYPQGQSPESGLTSALEMCVEDLCDEPMYKTDARFLRVWLELAQYHQEPQDVFSFMAQKGIGQNLALFFEEFATFLEKSHKIEQARRVYTTGISVEARPVSRLKLRAEEFERRHPKPDTSGDSSASNQLADSDIPPALSLKMSSGRALVANMDTYQPPAHKSRISVFQDAGGIYKGQPSTAGEGWTALGSIAQRRKENNHPQAQSWKGQRMPLASGTAPKKAKAISVFKDPKAKEEKMAVALEYLRDENGEEFCLEELLVRLRGIQGKRYPRIETTQEPLREKPSQPTLVGAEHTATMFTEEARAIVGDFFSQPLDKAEKSHTIADSDNEDEEMGDYGHHTLSDHEGMTTNPLKRRKSSQTNNQQPNETKPKRERIDLDGTTEIKQLIQLSSQTHNIYANPASNSVRRQLSSYIKNVLTSRECYYYVMKNHEPCFSKLKRLYPTGGKAATSLTCELEFPPYERLVISLLLGEGGYGRVYLAKDSEGELVAVKSEKDEVPWEYYVLYRAHQRLANTRTSISIISPLKLFQLEHEQLLVLNYMPQGTLLDLVNAERAATNKMGLNEQLVMFFAIELLRTVENIHSNRLIHGDIKADNVMLRMGDELPSPQWDSQYRADGSGMWKHIGLMLLDFGKGIDMDLYPPGATFTSDWDTDEEDCQEMQQHIPWSYQADYHGIATILHLLLFGQKIKTVSSPKGIKLATPLKRYWQTEMWSKVFDQLLNSARTASDLGLQLPFTNVMAAMRQELERQLSKNCRSLKAKLTELHSNRGRRI